MLPRRWGGDEEMQRSMAGFSGATADFSGATAGFSGATTGFFGARAGFSGRKTHRGGAGFSGATAVSFSGVAAGVDDAGRQSGSLPASIRRSAYFP
jgi:hypothetical protein